MFSIDFKTDPQPAKNWSFNYKLGNSATCVKRTQYESGNQTVASGKGK